MNIIDLKNKKFSSISERDYQLRAFAYKARIAYAKTKNLYRSVEDPKGLKEITPGLAQGYYTLEYFNKVLEDGRVHKMMHGQYEYLYGPTDMGIVTFDEWFDLPLNFENDIENVVLELIGISYVPVYSNKELIDELKEFVSNFEY